MAPARNAASAVDAGTTAYRALLRLYPHSFRHTYADELEADFDACSREAVESHGIVGLIAWWVLAGADFTRSMVREWRRTPWIPAACLAALIASVIFAGVWVRGKHAFVSVASADRPDSPELLVLMVLMVLIPIVGTIAIGCALRLTNVRAARWRRRV